MASYQEAARLQPSFAEAHCNLGVLHKAAGRLPQALQAYEAALKANPSFPLVHQNLAVAYTEQGTLLKEAGQLAEGAGPFRGLPALGKVSCVCMCCIYMSHVCRGVQMLVWDWLQDLEQKMPRCQVQQHVQDGAAVQALTCLAT